MWSKHMLRCSLCKILWLVIFCFCVLTSVIYRYSSQSSRSEQNVFLKWPKGKEDFDSCLKMMPDVHFNDFPKKAHDPQSEYFGLFYVNTYGRPTSCEPNGHSFYKKFTEGLPKWQLYFPNLMVSLKEYFKYNPNKSAKKFTSKNSFILFHSGDKRYVVGDTFEATIQAVDFRGERKNFGGDYFRARLLDISTVNHPLPSGIPCKIEDHMNGTYTVRAPLLVTGEFKLEVILCASVEAIAAYISWADGRIHQGFVFTAVLETGEKVKCNMDLLLYDEFKNKEICDYSNPRNNEPFFCSKPVADNCTKITYLIFLAKQEFYQRFKRPFNITHQLNTLFRTYQIISGVVDRIKVSPIQDESVRGTFERIHHFVDKKYSKNPSIYPTGIGYFGQWVSFVSNYDRSQNNNLAQCFSNKIVYMLGDSTMRQFFHFSASEFELSVKEKDADQFWHVPRVGRHETLNITIYYRSHGLPVRYIGPPTLAPYVTDTIDAIVGGTHVVIIITIGLHYVEYDPVFYIHRLVNIKKALEKHLKKFPETKIIIKGMNIARVNSLPFEWLVNRYDTILRETFKDLKNCVHVHLLDMTTLWPLERDYHPRNHILREQAYLMFSYACDTD